MSRSFRAQLLGFTGTIAWVAGLNHPKKGRYPALNMMSKAFLLSLFIITGTKRDWD